MDTVIIHVIALGLSLLFLAAGLQKLRLRESFYQVLLGYQLLPVVDELGHDGGQLPYGEHGHR